MSAMALDYPIRYSVVKEPIFRRLSGLPNLNPRKILVTDS
jgi:hypothetical protein